jgi:EAL domain-containing protein (putative c-di-GMP-specific phosphodiesterase class I)
LAGGTVRMNMQPIVDLRTNKPAYFESLARVVRDDQMIAAADFVPALDAAEIDRLFVIALAQSLEAVGQWLRSGLDVGVSVNIDPSTLAHPHCVGWITDALDTHDVAADRLILELLETRPVSTPRQAGTLRAIHELGVRVAIDDLGAGHSNLDRLEAFEFDIVKIDGAIIRALSSTPEEALGALSTLVAVGSDSGRSTVVEGIESAEMAVVASIVGARFGQGYAIARPMPIAAVAPWIAAVTPPEPGLAPSYSSALAFHLRRGSDNAHSGDVNECWISAFLAENSGGAPVDVWHAAQHGTAADDRADLGRRLKDWLVDHIVDPTSTGAEIPATR